MKHVIAVVAIRRREATCISSANFPLIALSRARGPATYNTVDLYLMTKPRRSNCHARRCNMIAPVSLSPEPPEPALNPVATTTAQKSAVPLPGAPVPHAQPRTSDKIRRLLCHWHRANKRRSQVRQVLIMERNESHA